MKRCYCVLAAFCIFSTSPAQVHQLFIPAYVFLDRCAEVKQETAASWALSALMPSLKKASLSVAGCRWYGLTVYSTAAIGFEFPATGWYWGARFQHAGEPGTGVDRVELRLARKIDQINAGAGIWLERQERSLEPGSYEPGMEASVNISLSPFTALLTRFEFAGTLSGFFGVRYKPNQVLYTSLCLIRDEGNHLFYQACITTYFRDRLHVSITVRTAGRGFGLRAGCGLGRMVLDISAQYHSRLGFTSMSFLNYQIKP